MVLKFSKENFPQSHYGPANGRLRHTHRCLKSFPTSSSPFSSLMPSLSFPGSCVLSHVYLQNLDCHSQPNNAHSSYTSTSDFKDDYSINPNMSLTLPSPFHIRLLPVWVSLISDIDGVMLRLPSHSPPSSLLLMNFSPQDKCFNKISREKIYENSHFTSSFL